MKFKDLLDKPNAPWLGSGGENKDVVLSSRVRLARNIENIPFPNRAQLSDLENVVESIQKMLGDLQNSEGRSYSFIKLIDLAEIDQYILVEKHIISPAFVKNAVGRAIIVSEDAEVSIMINEEDHMRLQCLRPGLDLLAAWELANKIDDILESRLNFAFDDSFGYLTACPTNLGTAMRASVMVHLPGLTLAGQLNSVITAINQVGITVRGLYGEGTDGIGNMLQISNQLTMGNAEVEIIDNLQSVIMQIVEKERAVRKLLYEEEPDIMEDKVWRALGTMRCAQKLSRQEALSLLSEIRMGVEMGLIKDVSTEILNELLILTGSNYLQKIIGNKEFDQKFSDKLRAQIVRSKLQ